MVRWLRWHCPPDTGFEIRALAVWGRTRYLCVTEATHNTRRWGRNIFVSFKPPRPGTEPRTLAWKAAVLTTTLGPPPSLIISKTYERDDVREHDRQRDHFQNCSIFVARRVRRRAGCHASHVALHVVIGRRVGVWTNTRFSCVLCFINEMKWNESGFRPPLCTHRLNWARRTSWGWWDDWDDTVLQTQDSKFEPWRSEAEHATSRSRRLPTILTFTRGWGRNNFVSFKPPRPGTEPRTLAWKAAVLTTTLGPPPVLCFKWMWSERAASEILNYIHMENQIKFILIILLEDIWDIKYKRSALLFV